MRRMKVDVPCAHCGTLIQRAPWELRRITTHYCSRSCYWAAMRSKTLAERFWEKVQKTDSCWLWMGACTADGYGYIHLTGDARVYAHRVSWELHGGSDATGLVLCHTCDTPPCVNPAHLFLGTHADNIRDKCEKGRAAQRLDAERVRAIRAAYAAGGVTQRALAAQYGVTPTNIRQVVMRRIWKHVA